MTDVIKHLVRLGLNEYEARAYVATVSLGEGTVNEISKESGVPRSRAYDTMERLARKGFVEMGNITPLRYRANDPLTASNHLMEGIRHANEEILRNLHELGQRAEKRDNPVWTLTGDWAIRHKIEELLEGAKSEAAFVFLGQRWLLRYADLITAVSHEKAVTVVLSYEPERFAGLLGKSRVMRLRPISGFLPELKGELGANGFVTMDGRYGIEMLLLVDQETILILTQEGEGRRAIIITGTILNLFGHDAVAGVIREAEEVVPKKMYKARGKGKTSGKLPVIPADGRE